MTSRLLRILGATAFLCLAPGISHAASDTGTRGLVVATCGAQSFPLTVGGLANYAPVTEDQTGVICTNGAGTSSNPSVVTPSGATTTQAKVTIAVTNTYQQALAASATRKGCTIQNNGTHTLFVFFGSAPGDTTTSYQLAPGQPLYCAVGGIVVATDAVQVTGTAGDVAVVTNQ